MTASEYLERFREDEYVVGAIRTNEATARVYNPYFRGREVNQERAAFRNFWQQPQSSLLQLHLEQKYGVNVSSCQEMGRVLLALRLLFFEIREEMMRGA